MWYVWLSPEDMLQRSRRLIGAVGLGRYSSVVAPRSEKLCKLGATLSTLPISRDAESGANAAVNWTLFGFLGASSVLFYWSIKRAYGHRLANLPVIEAASESDVPRSKRFNFLAEAVEKVLASVVYIEIQKEEQAVDNRKPKRIKVSNGSGFIVDERGLILTNAHVIAKAPYISVQLHSGDTFSATVIDVNEAADLALIKLELEARQEKLLSALKFGKSNELRPGEWVIALGSPLSLKNTVTSGIVSAVGRTGKELDFKRGADMEYIQTDAPITKGNSGGPLVNLDGEVVGINTMTASNSPGISFAVPSQIAEEFISSAQRISPEEKPKRYMLGVLSISPAIAMLDPILPLFHDIPMDVLNGVLLLRVWPGSPASKAGLQTYDIIVKINETPITSSSQLYDTVQKGKLFSVEVVRGQQKLRINITPEPII